MTSSVRPAATERVDDARARRAPEQPTGIAVAGLTSFSSFAYRYLFVGTMLTMSGYFMQQLAQDWLVYDLTGSPTRLGIVSYAGGIPMLLLSLRPTCWSIAYSGLCES